MGLQYQCAVNSTGGGIGGGADAERPRVHGKFLYAGKHTLHVKGVTYGVFRTSSHGFPFPDPDTVRRDFERMAANGINAVRTYTVPPGWLLDLAREHSLRVMVGCPWEQHITFLDDRRTADRIVARLREDVRRCAGHPAVLFYAIGNEIPASIVRWHGAGRVEAFLERLYRAVKEEDPEGLATYVNFPPTEYLHLPFLDLVCFNLYLESRPDLRKYITRLQNLAGERPLLLTELGLDSLRNGEEPQGAVLQWQIQEAFLGGCAGMFVFSWTDEWHRGGADILDWDFGLTRRDRSPKPALSVVRRTFAEAPFPSEINWPEISVVVCTFNGSRTIGETLCGIEKLNYPRFEVIVVNDGSTDGTAEVISRFKVRCIHTENRGLSAARNTGLFAARGEIVAYLDDDAYPDPDWLRYIALSFLRSGYAAVGGPNIPPAGDGARAECIANAPGGPIHVLLHDDIAEHIPGCNMAFRAETLRRIGGFDEQFRVAGDDVDICWHLQQQGYTIGFNPAAVVWHHRRNSLRTYWRQQAGYGRAEAMLAAKWPEKYAIGGNLHWQGRLYGRGLSQGGWFRRNLIYHGVWGSGLFQSLYHRPSSFLSTLPSIPAWHLLNALLLCVTILGLAWRPLLLALPLLGISAALPLPYVFAALRGVEFRSAGSSKIRRAASCLLTAGLYLVQPVARLAGRFSVRAGARMAAGPRIGFPWVRRGAVWSEHWRSAEEWLQELESRLRRIRVLAARGGAFDDWDLEAHGGYFCHSRLRMAIEEHGQGRQLLRFRMWPRPSGFALGAVAGLGGIASLSFTQSQAGVAGVTAGLAMAFAYLVLRDWALSLGALRDAIRLIGERVRKTDALDPKLETCANQGVGGSGPGIPQDCEGGRLAAGNRG